MILAGHRTVRARLQRSALRTFGRLPRRVRARLLRWTGSVAAIGAVAVVGRDEHVLLVRHAYRQGWGLPGGSLRRGEDPVAAVVREVGEELGVDVVVGGGVVVHDLDVARITFAYRATLPVGEPTCRSMEIVEVGWFPESNLPDLEDEAVEVLRALRSTAVPHVVPRRRRVPGARRFR